MRKRLLLVFGICVMGNGQLFAQSASPFIESRTPAEIAASDQVTLCPPICLDRRPDCGSEYRTWASADYLLWWVRNAPVPAALVTAGNPAIGVAAGVFTSGAIGQPGTQVLFGNSSSNFDAMSGVRFTMGQWLDSSDTIGIEGTGFLLFRQNSGFSAGSNAAGSPALYFPVFSPTANGGAGAERAFPISDPLRGFAGSVAINSSLQLWGAEANGIFNVVRMRGLEFSLLAGFRYADLQENLDINNPTTDLLLGNLQNGTDHFGTRNQFYGGQLGARLSISRDRLSVDLTGKVALGATHEVVDAQGSITQTALPGGFAPTPGTFPGFLYTQPSNIGSHSETAFGVIPTIELKISYQITEHLRAFIGYDFMYWNGVVRPGNQIDHSVNITQNPVIAPGGFFGPAVPQPQFNRSDFMATGLNIGMELRY
jgi:hypothetical protein